MEGASGPGHGSDGARTPQKRQVNGALEPDGWCRLLRDDGSVWTVTGLRTTEDGCRVHAHRLIRDEGTDGSEEMTRETLDGELLGSTDRLLRMDPDGRVYWAFPGAEEDGLRWRATPPAEVKAVPRPHRLSSSSRLED